MTSLGIVAFTCQQLRCHQCGHLWVPLRDALGLAPHQRHSAELERQAIETASEQTYRHSATALARTARIHVGKSTIHQWVRQSDSDARA